MPVAKVARKGQITLPKGVCKEVGVAAGDYVRVCVEGSRAIVEKSLGELAGALNPGYPVKGLAEELDRERKVRGSGAPHDSNILFKPSPFAPASTGTLPATSSPDPESLARWERLLVHARPAPPAAPH